MAMFTREMSKLLAYKVIKAKGTGLIEVDRANTVVFYDGFGSVRDIFKVGTVGLDNLKGGKYVTKWEVTVNDMRSEMGNITKAKLADYLYKKINALLEEQSNAIKREQFRRIQEINKTRNNEAIKKSRNKQLSKDNNLER